MLKERREIHALSGGTKMFLPCISRRGLFFVSQPTIIHQFFMVPVKKQGSQQYPVTGSVLLHRILGSKKVPFGTPLKRKLFPAENSVFCQSRQHLRDFSSGGQDSVIGVFTRTPDRETEPASGFVCLRGR
jgi:hypothetical protein